MEGNFHEYQIEQLMVFECVHEKFIISNFAFFVFWSNFLFPRLQQFDG